MELFLGRHGLPAIGGPGVGVQFGAAHDDFFPRGFAAKGRGVAQCSFVHVGMSRTPYALLLSGAARLPHNPFVMLAESYYRRTAQKHFFLSAPCAYQ
jgi:hypothetical protein